VDWVAQTLADFIELRRTLAQLKVLHENLPEVEQIPANFEDWRWYAFPAQRGSRISTAHDSEDDASDDDAAADAIAAVPYALAGSDDASPPAPVPADVGEVEQGPLVWQADDDTDAVDREGAAADAATDDSAAMPPWVSSLAALDHVGQQRLLRRFVALLERRLRGRGAAQPPGMAVISHAEAAWLYGALARVDLPLLPEAAADVRRIFVICHQLRRGLATSEGSIDHPLIGLLNTLLVVAGRFFGQELPSDAHR
jgi:hypothetical protein